MWGASRVSFAVPGERSVGSNAVNVAVLGEHSRRSDGAAAGSSPRTIGLLEGIETHVSKNLANVGMMTDLVEGMEGVRSALGARRDYGGARTARATAGERAGITGSSHHVVTRFSSNISSGDSSRARMSYLDAVLSAPARAPAAALVARCSAPSSAAVGLCMYDDG